MRLGGPARYVVEIEKPEEIPDAYEFARQNQLPTFILGYGANAIGRDEGFAGVIIINRIRGISEISKTAESTVIQGDLYRSDSPADLHTETAGWQQIRHLIKIMGGEYWDDVVKFSCEKGFTGIEAMSKIPGLAGSAPVQNIGAYGQELADTFVKLEAYDSITRKTVTLSKKDLHFAYRQSIFNTSEKNRYFIISITLGLLEGQMKRPFYNSLEKYIDAHSITDFSPMGIRKIVSTVRAEKLPDPLKIASSGSFFHNVYLTEAQAERALEQNIPVYQSKEGFKVNAAWLIESCGLKGKLISGFRVSAKAPLVLINESATSHNDLDKAKSEIVGKVYDKFGYWLEQEPVEIQ